MWVLVVVAALSVGRGSDPNAHLKYGGPVFDLAMLHDPPDDYEAEAYLDETIDGVQYRCSLPKVLADEVSNVAPTA